MFKQLHINITLADALILMPKYQKMLKALLSNKEKLQELANIPLNENCSAKLGLPKLIPTRMTRELANRTICTPVGIARDVFIPVGKFTFLADFVIVDYESDPRVPLILGRPLLRNARPLIDVHGEEMILHDEGCNVLSEKLLDLDSTKDLHPPLHDNPLSGSTTYPLLEEFADELPLEYDDNLQFDIESDLKEIEFLLYQDKDSSLKDSINQKNHAHLADIFVDALPSTNNEDKIFNPVPVRCQKPGHLAAMLGCAETKVATWDDLAFKLITLSEDFLEDLFSTNQPSGNPTFSSHPELPSLKVKDDIFNPEGSNVLPEKLLDLDSTKDPHPPHHVSITFSSPNQLLKEFADELAIITFSSRNDDLPSDIESNLKEIDYLLHHDPIKDIDSILKDSIDQSNIVDLNDNLVDSMPEMFTKEHALDYSSPPLYNEYDDNLFIVKSDIEYVYDDPFDSKGEKIKVSKLLIDKLDLPCDFLLPSEYDSFFSKDFSEDDALPSTNNGDKIFKLGNLIQENLFEVIAHVAPEKNEKKLAISH
nr:hypothetical protein [Tanacetum cinerariifolium]